MNADIEDTWFQDAIVWRNIMQNLRQDEAVAIIDSEEQDLNDYMIELVPFMMQEKRYRKVYIYSSKREIVESVERKSWKFAQVKLIKRDILSGYVRIQRGYGFVDRVYTNEIEGLDDDNPMLLLGEGGLTRKDIVAHVFLEMKNNPKDAAITLQNVVCDKTFEIDIKKIRKNLPLDKYKYSITREFLETRLHELEKSKLISTENRIILYGDSMHAHECISLIKEKYEYYLVDKNEKKHKRIINGSLIYSPDDMLKKYNPSFRIFVMIFHYQEVCDYLLKLGYELGKQVFILNYKDDIGDFDDAYLRERMNYTLSRGEEAYNSIRKRYKQEHILLSSFYASGDIYLASLYLEEYIKRNHIDKYVVVVTSKAAQTIASLFGYEAILIPKVDAFFTIDYARVMGFEELKLHNINVCVGKQRIEGLFGRVDINTMHQRLTFRDDKRRCIPNMRQSNSDEIYAKNRIEKEQTILIAPYSNTEGNLPEEFCNALVKRLKEKSYDVCTNIGPGEESLNGTIGLQIPYSQILDFVNKCACFISVRSGLCDIVSSTGSPMVVFYQSKDRIIYDLAEMGLKTDKILQYNVDEIGYEHVIEEIEEFIDKN